MRRLCLCAALLILPGACGPAGVVVGAGAVAGVGAAQERGFKGAMNDQRIRLDINDLWFKNHHSRYRGVNLQVQEGRALLSGTVPDPETRVTAVRLAWQASGVREVINEIEIADSSSLSDMARDTWISTKLKARLLGDREVDAINYSIEVVNGAVFLIGIAQDQAELDRVIAHARDISYVRRVVNYVRIKS